ncbi:Lipase 2 [Planctomycetes bacterium Pan216]|uniref:Lipase 2 n=1 Tax=Kolteria novifilia TaxID=2527975 RepID=A0A518B657_9BACT|nr:Lipase 2 [Planctomycetes bacterium Pan216]
MKHIVTWAVVVGLSFGLGVGHAAAPKAKAPQRQAKSLADFEARTYKTVDGVPLTMYIKYPKGHQKGDKRPAIVFFFGGGWAAGSPSQFAQQCRYLASRGMVAMAADYRVKSRHQSQAKDSVADAKSAIRWVRANADSLGIDPDRIVSSGGSAGGHLAAAVATLDGFNNKGDDTSISERPNAAVLFNPAVDVTLKGMRRSPEDPRAAKLGERLGVSAEEISPAKHISGGLPPMIIFHGKEDKSVPYAQVVDFTKAMKEAGNRCELVGFDGMPHGFFNYGRNKNQPFAATVRSMDEFLTSLGYLEGEPTVEVFLEKAN